MDLSIKWMVHYAGGATDSTIWVKNSEKYVYLNIQVWLTRNFEKETVKINGLRSTSIFEYNTDLFKPKQKHKGLIS